MSEQDSTQANTLQRPANDDKEGWKAYWQAKGQEWRTEPEIDPEWQRYLNERRSVTPHIEQAIYSFKDITLSRADVEWLVATHENGHGPVVWANESQRGRRGLDLRGADLKGENLGSLPLACVHGGLTIREQASTNEMQETLAAVHLEGTNLSDAHLEGAQLARAHLEGANLHRAYLEHTSFRAAHLEGANLRTAHLESVFFGSAYLNGKVMEDQEFERVRQRKPDFPKILPPANLRYSFLSTTTNLQNICLGDTNYGYVSAVDVRWGDVNLAVVKWEKIQMLGDEREARQKMRDGVVKDRSTRLEEYEIAVRANRQLATVLRNQGLNEEADYFAYRAQLLQRKVLWYQQYVGRWLFSIILALLSGYGYRLWRILAAYVVVVSLFGFAYFVMGIYYPPYLHLDQAYLQSITAFHGRVFSEQFSSNTPQIWVTAFEAVTGLVIEGVFIAMLVQRFFGK